MISPEPGILSARQVTTRGAEYPFKKFRGRFQMARFTSFILATVLIIAFAIPATAEDLSSQIVGVWKIVSNYNKEVATGKTNYPLGQRPAGYVVYKKGGRVIFAIVAGDRAKPAAGSATDAERVMLY